MMLLPLMITTVVVTVGVVVVAVVVVITVTVAVMVGFMEDPSPRLLSPWDGERSISSFLVSFRLICGSRFGSFA
jgi:hypothetical protein